MDWSKVFGKGLTGVGTFVFAWLAAQLAANQVELVQWAQTAIGAIVAGVVVAVTNWLKHRSETS